MTLNLPKSYSLNTVKPVLSGHSKRPKIGFQGRLSLNAGQKYCRMLQESILQYFRPSLSYHLSLKPLFWLFLSGRLRQVLLYSSCLSSIPLIKSSRKEKILKRLALQLNKHYCIDGDLHIFCPPPFCTLLHNEFQRGIVQIGQYLVQYSMFCSIPVCTIMIRMQYYYPHTF